MLESLGARVMRNTFDQTRQGFRRWRGGFRMQEIVSALLSGAVAALVATFVTLAVEGRRENRRQKLNVLSQFVSHRNDVTGVPFTAAMNGTLAVYANSPEVLRAHEELYAAVSTRDSGNEANRRLVNLWRAMSKSAGIDTTAITDAQFVRVMNPRATQQ